MKIRVRQFSNNGIVCLRRFGIHIPCDFREEHGTGFCAWAILRTIWVLRFVTIICPCRTRCARKYVASQVFSVSRAKPNGRDAERRTRVRAPQGEAGGYAPRFKARFSTISRAALDSEYSAGERVPESF